MAEILSVAEENGKSVTVSFYEVYQDRVCDLLDSKQQTVLVLEDKGKIQLKGLSRASYLVLWFVWSMENYSSTYVTFLWCFILLIFQVPVKSISDFQRLYVGFGSRKPAQKGATELPRRGHKGLIVHVSSPNEKLDTPATGKMNFVDLAGCMF